MNYINRDPKALYGKGDVDALFGGGPLTTTPFPRAGRRKDLQDFDKSLVEHAVRSEQEPVDVDPRGLWSNQPSVTRHIVRHYMENSEVFADQNQSGNQVPVVYRRTGLNPNVPPEDIILSGHHRATAALLQGRPLRARLVEGGFGGPRYAPQPTSAPSTSVTAATWDEKTRRPARASR